MDGPFFFSAASFLFCQCLIINILITLCVLSIFQSIMIIGGRTDYSYTAYVKEYDIDADTYNAVQSLPTSLRSPTAVLYNGYMYAFGDKSNGKNVVRIALTLENDWEQLEDMEISDYDMVVIPYN